MRNLHVISETSVMDAGIKRIDGREFPLGIKIEARAAVAFSFVS
jgi:hypothetical protein